MLALTIMRLSKRSIGTFVRYAAYSIAVFVPEYILFLLLIQYTSFHYVPVTVGTFIFGITLQYSAVRRFVFAHTLREWQSGFMLFVTSSIAGAGFVVLLMIIFVEMLSIPQYSSRLLAGAIAGYCVYLFNVYTTFIAPKGDEITE